MEESVHIFFSNPQSIREKHLTFFFKLSCGAHIGCQFVGVLKKGDRYPVKYVVIFFIKCVDKILKIQTLVSAHYTKVLLYAVYIYTHTYTCIV